MDVCEIEMRAEALRNAVALAPDGMPVADVMKAAGMFLRFLEGDIALHKPTRYPYHAGETRK